MLKKFTPIFIFLFVFFINVVDVNAVTCSDMTAEINNYKSIEKKLSSIDCSKDTDSKIVNECNRLNLKKSNSISTLYRMKQQNTSCGSAITSIDKIIKDNENRCSKISDGVLEDITNTFLNVIYILAPIIAILLTSLDYTKAIMSNDSSALRKTSIKFAKRLFAVILVFAIPAIVNIVIGLNNTDYLLSGEGYSCKSDYVILKQTYSITYVPKEESASTSDNSLGGGFGGSASTGGSGNYLNWKQCGSSWSNLSMGGSSTVCRSGCLVTSVAMQMANSGTLKKPNSFNPGVFVKTLNSNGGFSGADFNWTGWQSLAPKFKIYNNRASISGTQNQKAKQLATYIKNKFYPVIEVKSCLGRNYQHWVAVISVQGTKVTMADPASSSTDLAHYQCFKNTNSQRVALFQVK